MYIYLMGWYSFWNESTSEEELGYLQVKNNMQWFCCNNITCALYGEFWVSLVSPNPEPMSSQYLKCSGFVTE